MSEISEISVNAIWMEAIWKPSLLCIETFPVDVELVFCIYCCNPSWQFVSWYFLDIYGNWPRPFPCKLLTFTTKTIKRPENKVWRYYTKMSGRRRSGAKYLCVFFPQPKHVLVLASCLFIPVPWAWTNNNRLIYHRVFPAPVTHTRYFSTWHANPTKIDTPVAM